jgi:hypothetical protein
MTRLRILALLETYSGVIDMLRLVNDLAGGQGLPGRQIAEVARRAALCAPATATRRPGDDSADVASCRVFAARGTTGLSALGRYPLSS